LPTASSPVSVHHADARELPLESSSIDLVLTSPPYINVFNYHQKFRRSVEALEWDVLRVARSEIGSNRQNRGNRFLTVIQYSLDMALALREARRVVKSNGRLIFVLGRESKVRGTAFFNGELVAELAVRAVGLELENRQERRFKNRFGLDIYEDVLHFVPAGASPTIESSLESARGIAGRALVSARPHVPEKERCGLEDALDRLHEVDPSPVLEEAPKLRAG
jgi:SAM-dependent methyltransferase